MIFEPKITMEQRGLVEFREFLSKKSVNVNADLDIRHKELTGLSDEIKLMN